MNNTIKEYTAQFFLIVFSVVLGLYLSERIEERKERQAAEDLLMTIKAEVKDNINLLRYWYPYHEEISGGVDSLSRDEAFRKEFISDKNIFFEKLFTRGTFMGRAPSNDAWDIAKSHPLIVKVEYDQYLILSRIYTQQELTYAPMIKAFEIFDSKEVNSEQNAVANLASISNSLKDLAAREKQLLIYYQQGEEILDLKEDSEIDE